jgi:hypothetical protein
MVYLCVYVLNNNLTHSSRYYITYYLPIRILEEHFEGGGGVEEINYLAINFLLKKSNDHKLLPS